MEKLQWLFELLDRMSGPAKKINTSLGGVDKALKKTQTASHVAMPKVAGDFSNAAASMKESGGIMNDAIATAIGGLLKDAVIGGARLAAAGGKWMLDSLMFKENTLISLEAILGSKEAAEAMFKKATAFAAKTPFSSGQVANAFERLAASGFRGEELEKMMSSIGDLAGTEVAKVDRALLVISQIKGKGKLQGEELMQLAEMGLPMNKIFESLAKSMGKTTDEVQKLLSAGKISADQGIGAIQATIAGTFGGRMEKASNSLAGLWSTLMSAPEDVLFAQGDKLNALIDPIKKLVKTAIDMLGPEAPAGKLLGQVFVRAGDIIGRVATAVSTIDFEKWFGKAESIIKDLEPKLTALWAGFSKVFGTGDVAASFGEILETIAWRIRDMNPKTLENLGTVLGYVAFAVLKLVQWTVELGVAAGWVMDRLFDLKLFINDLDQTIADFVMNFDFADGFRSIGTNAMQGLVDGIMSMGPSATSAVAGMGDSLISTIQSKLGIASPSTVFAEIGEFTGLGFLQGMQASGMNGAIASPMSPSTAIAPSIIGGGAAVGGGQQIMIDVGGIIVQVDGTGKNGAEIAKEAAGSIGGELMNALRGLATQAGG